MLRRAFASDCPLRHDPSTSALKGASQDEVLSSTSLILSSATSLRRVSKSPAPAKAGDGRMRRLLPLAALIATLHASATARAAESDLIEQGRDLYADTCAICHGRDMVNTGALAFDLRKFPKDDFARFRDSVLNGKSEAMPAWRDKIDDNDLAALWAYVRSGG
jgi:mono/diheme cytochrome c family protein